VPTTPSLPDCAAPPPALGEHLPPARPALNAAGAVAPAPRACDPFDRDERPKPLVGRLLQRAAQAQKRCSRLPLFIGRLASVPDHHAHKEATVPRALLAAAGLRGPPAWADVRHHEAAALDEAVVGAGSHLLGGSPRQACPRALQPMVLRRRDGRVARGALGSRHVETHLRFGDNQMAPLVDVRFQHALV